jgi:hypothetical protein
MRLLDVEHPRRVAPHRPVEAFGKRRTSRLSWRWRGLGLRRQAFCRFCRILLICLESYRSIGKRELINTGTDKRFVRRGAKGRFKESDDVGKSLAADRRKKMKTKVKSGQGDRGDR